MLNLYKHSNRAPACFQINTGDQTGEGLSMQKHCFANPNNGKICCILSLAIMIVCRHGVMLKDGERSQRLFCDDSLARFGNVFNSIVHMTRIYSHLILTWALMTAKI